MTFSIDNPFVKYVLEKPTGEQGLKQVVTEESISFTLLFYLFLFVCLFCFVLISLFCLVCFLSIFFFRHLQNCKV